MSGIYEEPTVVFPIEEIEEVILQNLDLSRRLDFYLSNHPNYSFKQFVIDAIHEKLEKLEESKPSWVEVIEVGGSILVVGEEGCHFNGKRICH